MLIKTEKFHAKKCMIILQNVSSLFDGLFSFKLFNKLFFFYSELRKREADDFISNLDPSNTKKITLEAYIRDNYGDIDRDHLEGPDRPELNLREGRRVRFDFYQISWFSFAVFQLYALDKQKWKHLDTDGDDSLTYDEFRRFLRPEDDEGLRKIEVNSILKEYDEDNDGKISQTEYIAMTGMLPDYIIKSKRSKNYTGNRFLFQKLKVVRVKL